MNNLAMIFNFHTAQQQRTPIREVSASPGIAAAAAVKA